MVPHHGELQGDGPARLVTLHGGPGASRDAYMAAVSDFLARHD